jgi:hypothetical protein
MLYRELNGDLTEVVATGRPVGDVLTLDTNGDPTWAAGSDTLGVRNQSGSDMTKGQVVRIDGFNVGEDLPTVQLAQADSNTNSRAVAMLAEDIADNTNGTAVITGVLEGLDTAAFGAGSQLYLSDTTPGDVIQTAPSNPEYTTFIGWTRRASGGTNGSILVKVEGNARPMGTPYLFGGDADTGVEDDFFRANGEFTSSLIGALPGPPLGSIFRVPPGGDGVIDGLSWQTATATAPPPGNAQTDFTIWQNGAAIITVSVVAGQDPSGEEDLRPSAVSIAEGDELAINWSAGTSPGESTLVLHTQRN